MIDWGIIERGRSMYEESRTICWGCANACGNGCSWSRDGVPVEGWTARPTMIVSYGTQSYCVTACPEYVVDERGKAPREFKTEGCAALLEHALKIARDDYIRTGSSIIRDEVVCFMACWLEDYEDALKKLHADRKAYWEKKWQRIHQRID